RARAATSGAQRCAGTFRGIERGNAAVEVHFRREDGTTGVARTRAVIGADGANSAVARCAIAGAEETPYVFAYHEIVRSPPAAANSEFDARRCDVYYRGAISPDFYGWVFPHGATTSVGAGTARKGFQVRRAVEELRAAAGLADVATVRRE